MKPITERRRTSSEKRLDNQRHLNLVEKEGMKQPNYKSTFTERPHYGIPEPVKGGGSGE